MTRFPGSRIDGAASVRLLCRWLREPNDASAGIRFADYYALHSQPLRKLLARKLRALGADSPEEQAHNGYQELMTATCKRLAPRQDRLLRSHLLLKQIKLPTANDLLHQAFANWRNEALGLVGEARWIIHLFDHPDLQTRVDDLNARLIDASRQGARLLVQRLNEARVELADSKGYPLARAGQIVLDNPAALFQAVLERSGQARIDYLNARFPGLAHAEHDAIRGDISRLGEVLVNLGRCRLPNVGYLIRALDNVAIDQLRGQDVCELSERTVDPPVEQGIPHPVASRPRAVVVSFDDWERTSAGRIGDGESDELRWSLSDDQPGHAFDPLRASAERTSKSLLWLTIEKLLGERRRELEARLRQVEAAAKMQRHDLEARLDAEIERHHRVVNVLLLQALGYGQEEIAALLNLSRDQVRSSQQQCRKLSLRILQYWIRHFRDMPAIRARLDQWGADSALALAVLDGLFEGLDDVQLGLRLALATSQVKQWRARLAETAAAIVAGWIERALADRPQTEWVVRHLNSNPDLIDLRASLKVKKHG